MDSITIADFRVRHRAFADTTTYPDPLIQIQIDDSLTEMDAGAWGDFFHRGQGLLIAHLLTLDDLLNTGSGSEAGLGTLKPIALESEGDTSISYAGGGAVAGMGNDTVLASTLYGQQFIELRAKVIIGVASSGSSAGSIPRPRPRGLSPGLPNA